jgi:hypothetical protein
MTSIYHATVRKEGDRWAYRVFEDWGSDDPWLVVGGFSSIWITAFALAAGAVRAFRIAYEWS